MNKLEPGQVYDMLRRKKLFKAKGIHASKMVNFEKFNASDKVHYFERLIHMISTSGGLIDINVYLDAIVDHFDGEWFDLGILPSQRGIRIYNDYIQFKRQTQSSSVGDLSKSVFDSIGFIVKFCHDNKLKSLDEYLSHNPHYPSVLVHYKSGSVTGPFLSLVDGFNYLLALTYPQDIVIECKASKLRYELKNMKTQVLRYDKLRTVHSKLNKIIMSLISKMDS